MKYDCSSNKHLCIRHAKLRAKCLNYPKQTHHMGLSTGLKILLNDTGVLLTSMAGQTFKNLSSRHAIKLERSSKHRGSVATPQKVNWQQILS